MEIAPFLDLLVKMVRNWSQDATTKEFEFRESFKVTDKCYELDLFIKKSPYDSDPFQQSDQEDSKCYQKDYQVV